MAKKCPLLLIADKGEKCLDINLILTYYLNIKLHKEGIQ